jgi:hypothetical protein
MKNKIIKCKSCGWEIKSPEDIVYVEDAAVYFDIQFKNGEIHYRQRDIKSLEFGEYLCGSCHEPLPIYTEQQMINYLKRITPKR